MPSSFEAFVRNHTKIKHPPLCPEIKLHLATEMMPLWQSVEKKLSINNSPPPLWAFCWAGGQALARYILDNPNFIKGKNVLDFATGGGIVAIAAAKVGAVCVAANDIDAFSPAATSINAKLNKVNVDFIGENLVGKKNQGWDVVLAGDICYNRPLAKEAFQWLHSLAKSGTLVLIGDPKRPYLPKEGLIERARYTSTTPLESEDAKITETSVLQVVDP